MLAKDISIPDQNRLVDLAKVIGVEFGTSTENPTEPIARYQVIVLRKADLEKEHFPELLAEETKAAVMVAWRHAQHLGVKTIKRISMSPFFDCADVQGGNPALVQSTIKLVWQ